MDLTTKTAAIQKAVGVKIDGVYGPDTADAILTKLGIASAKDSPTPPRDKDPLHSIGGRGFVVEVDGDDLIVRGARCTCFGGTDDPQDSGETASGISTKPADTIGVALPRCYTGNNRALIEALGGSPIPAKLPFKTMVEITSGGQTQSGPFIDLGPNLETTKNSKGVPNLLDVTVALAKRFNPKATSRNFEMICDYRIIGGAKFVGA